MKTIKKYLELPHRETIISTNTLQTKPFDNQKTENMSNNKQQTAVDWYDNEIGKLFDQFLMGKIKIYDFQNQRFKLEKQAKEMQKEQMDKVAEDWWNEGARSVYDGKRKYESFEQYYNETYGGGDK
jgi:hypothetical protein